MPELIIESLVKNYGTVRATHSVDLSIKDGEFVTLLGPSGCGKTTMLRCIAGLEDPDGGRISIGDTVVADPKRSILVPAHRRNLGMVFQSYALWPHMSVAGNIAYPLKQKRKSRNEINARVGELLETVGMTAMSKRYVSELSGGQQQRVALARALASSSDLVLYDEPLSNLDAGLRIAMREEIRSVHDRLGTTSIFVTHDQEEALALSDRVVVLDRGRIVQVGTPREVYSAPVNAFVARFLGFENIFEITTIVSDPDGGTSVGVAEGALSLSVGPDDLRPGGGVAIKAAHVRLGDAVRPGGGSTFQGNVTRKNYLGERTEFVIDVNGVDVQALVHNHLVSVETLPSVGAPVPVQFPEHLLAPLAPAAV